MTPEAADALVLTLQRAIEPALPGLCANEWSHDGIGKRFLMRTHVPVIAFRAGAKTLCFIVTPTDPSAPAYKRSKHHDLVYFSEDVPDHQQSEIYRRDRDMIDRVSEWLRRWDG